MESSGPVQLLENDGVPGSKLDTRILDRYKVTQLQRWLECRKLSTTGNKECLKARILKRVKTGRHHILDVGVDGGKWVELKRKKIAEQCGTKVPKKKCLPITGWKPFPGFNIPQMFNEGHIYHYIVESVPRVLPIFLQDLATDDVDDPGSQEDSGRETEEEDAPAGSTETFRRGRLYIKSRFVLSVRDKLLGDKYYLKAEVRASMKMEKRNVTATISTISGSVLDGSCTCKQRSMGRCSHVAALLLYVSKWVEDNGHSAATCTGKPREWGKGSVKRNPGRTVEKDYYSRDFQRNANFDPRPTAAQNNNSLTTEELNDLFKAIQTTDRNSVLLKHIPISYEDSEDFEPRIDQDFQVSDYDLTKLKEKVHNFYDNYSEAIQANEDPYLIPNTELQSKSKTWHMLRSLMFTASIAKTVLGLKSPQAKMNFLRMRLWNMKRVCTADMEYGIKNEAKALQAYIKKVNDSSLEVKTTGLWVRQSHPWLGCSPDALVYKNGHLIKIVEIKIMKSVRNMRPSQFNKNLTKKQLAAFPLKRQNHNTQLRTWHSHYYQVQMTMEVMRVPECDYVIWSPKGVVIVPVSYDKDFWEPKLNKLIKLHCGLTVTDYFLQRAPRGLYPIPIMWEETDE